MVDTKRKGERFLSEEKYIMIGKNIRRFRMKNFYSQEKLAELLDISTNHLHRIENAKSHISLPLLLKVAEVFDVELNDFLKEEYETRKEILMELDEILTKCSDIEKEIIRQTVFNLYHTLRNVGV